MTATRPSRTGADYPALVLKLFARLFPEATWQAWRVWLKATLAVPLTPAERAIYRLCTGRHRSPRARCREVWTIASRRSGKSRLAAFVVVCLAVLKKYKLAPGEKPVVLLISPTLRQTQIVLGYVEAILELVPGCTVRRRTQDTIELSNRVTIMAQVASFRSLRGHTLVAVVFDEVAFFRDDSGANPDREILRAARPSLASVPGSLLVAISSPYAQRGELHRMYERHFGRPDDTVLVWKAATRTMNPTIPQQLVDEAMEDDPASALAEYGGEFRADLEELFTKAALDACVVGGRYELAPVTGMAYVGFVDPSGGSSDSMTLAIAHRDPASSRVVLDLVREHKPPFSPEQVTKQCADDLRRYRVAAAYSDAYAGQWVVEEFQKHGITIAPPILSDDSTRRLTRSELYLELLPLVNSGNAELLDHPRLLGQLQQLERRTGRSGKDAVDHPRAGHDDVANAAAGALVLTTMNVGLRATLPPDFTECINPVAASRCAFLFSSPWFPLDAHCRKHCPGLRAVLPAYQQHQQQARAAGDQPLTAQQFVKARFEPNRMQNLIIMRQCQTIVDGLGF